MSLRGALSRLSSTVARALVRGGSSHRMTNDPPRPDDDEKRLDPVEVALRDSDQRLRAFVANVPVVMFATDADGVLTLLEGKGLDAAGVELPPIGVSVFERYPGQGRITGNIRRALSGEAFVDNVPIRELCFETHYTPVRNDKGSVTGVVAVAIDVTKRVRAEEALSASRALFEQVVDQAPVGIVTTDAEGRIVSANPATLAIFGRGDDASFVGINPFEETNFTQSELAGIFSGALQGEPGSRTARYTTNHGKTADVHILTTPLRNPDGSVRGVLAVIEDIGDRLRAVEALHTESAFRERVMESATDAIVAFDLGGRFTLVNRRACEISGFSESELVGRDVTEIIAPDRGDIARLIESVGERGETISNYQTELVRSDGTRRTISVNLAPLTAGGAIVGIAGTASDITEQKKLEQQYLQAQKMEGIGRLAGGVAHDFGNLMTAIIVTAELDLTAWPSDEVARADMQEIHDTATRAANLSQQLLAFSRRQFVEPKVIELNELVLRTEKMLRRLVGANIEMSLLTTPDAGAVMVDPGQFEQVLVNLVVNAHDAMPEGGSLLIETSCTTVTAMRAGEDGEVRPGEYAVIAVTDTGAGMSDDVRQHLFEPFYTTKEVGKGTGLGLATCYGIVTQAGGHIWVYSEAGRGTTFKIYLPHISAALDEPEPPEVAAALPHGDETVLLVEDEPSVRRLAARVLRELGYTVLEAEQGEHGLNLFGEHASTVDLIVTDIVMPRMGGYDMMARIQSGHGPRKVLYMSGYTENAVLRSNLIEHSINFLQKPFSPRTLAIKVREVLDEPLTAQPVPETNS